jgi:hypothetical protein
MGRPIYLINELKRVYDSIKNHNKDDIIKIAITQLTALPNEEVSNGQESSPLQ